MPQTSIQMQQQLKIRHMWEACSLGHASSCKESGKPSSQDVLVFQPKNLVSSTREFWAELKAVKEKYKFVAQRQMSKDSFCHKRQV